MKNLIFLLFCSCIVLLVFSACSDNSTGGDSSNEPTLEKVANILNVQQGAGLVYRNALQETGDTLIALDAMGQWIGNNEAVEEAYYHDLESIRIHYKNGLKSSIHIVPTDEDGVHLSRGGGATSGLKNFVFNSQKTKGKPREIKNKKVLVLSPYTAEFNYSKAAIAELRESFGSDLEVDIITDEEVGLDDVNRMGDYGLIIMDTHGQKHGFYLGRLEREFVEQDPWLVDDWTPENTQRELLEPYKIPVDKIESGEIEITQNIYRRTKVDFIDGEIVEFEVEVFSISVIVTENYIRNASIDLTDAIVFGNHCYSGHTADGPNKNNMAEAWRSKGAAAYYGYAYENGVSIPVDNLFALAMEKALIKRLVGEADTTGTAHLKDDGSRYFWDSRKLTFRDGRAVTLSVLTPEVEEEKPVVPFYFNQYFDMDYSYDTCGTLIDSRDGEEYELACIGEQTWMAENLKYLPFVHSSEEFEEAGENSQPGYRVYGYDGNNVSAAKTEQNYATYGVLYNWWASMAGQAPTNSNPSGIQGICPDGWHLPSKAEWDELNDFLGGQNVAGGKLKEAGTVHWSSPNTGATNETGFTALPGGTYNLGTFTFLNEVGFFWSASDTSSGSGSLGRVNLLKHDDAISKIGAAGTGNGYSCRCVKDIEEE